MSLWPDSIVTIYSDTMAYILILGLITMTNQFKVGKDHHANMLYFRLCIITMINALSNGISYALHHQVTNWPEPVRLIFPTIAEYSALLAMFVWFLYIDYKLYGIWDRTAAVFNIYKIPVYVMGILCIINLFTGVAFSVTENHIFVAKPLYYVLLFTVYLYGIFPIVLIIRYMKENGPLHFFHISTMIIPTVTAGMITAFSDYSARALGFAIALVFLHMSYINLWRFEDNDSGFYNKHYISYVLEQSKSGKADYHSAIEFVTANTPEEFYDILRIEVPGKAEIIRMGENRFLLFSESSKSSMITLLSSMIQDAADEYDELHKDDEPIDLVISYSVRGKGESAEDFVKAAAQA